MRTRTLNPSSRRQTKCSVTNTSLQVIHRFFDAPIRWKSAIMKLGPHRPIRIAAHSRIRKHGCITHQQRSEELCLQYVPQSRAPSIAILLYTKVMTKVMKSKFGFILGFCNGTPGSTDRRFFTLGAQHGRWHHGWDANHLRQWLSDGIRMADLSNSSPMPPKTAHQ